MAEGSQSVCFCDGYTSLFPFEEEHAIILCTFSVQLKIYPFHITDTF